MTPGDCFPTALKLAGAIYAEGAAEQVLVVHGLPVGQGELNAGLRYWHAWVELKVPGGEWAVADYSNGRRFVLRRTDFYRQGKVRQHLLWRYTLEQAAAAMETWGHAGPWMDRAKADALDETGLDMWMTPDRAAGDPQPVENPVEAQR